jgi:hypothetical protein
VDLRRCYSSYLQGFRHHRLVGWEPWEVTSTKACGRLTCPQRNWATGSARRFDSHLPAVTSGDGAGRLQAGRPNYAAHVDRRALVVVRSQARGPETAMPVSGIVPKGPVASPSNPAAGLPPPGYDPRAFSDALRLRAAGLLPLADLVIAQ